MPTVPSRKAADGQCRRHGAPSCGRLGCIAFIVTGLACFMISTCTSSLCRPLQLRWRLFPARSCWYGERRWPTQAPGMKSIFFTAKTWTGACAFSKKAGKSCLCQMHRLCIIREPAAALAPFSWNGTSTRGRCGSTASSFGRNTPVW